MGRFPKMVVPQNGWFQWFIVENPMRIDYWGVYTHFGKVTESDLIRLWEKEAGANQLKPTDQKPDLKWKHSKNQRKTKLFQCDPFPLWSSFVLQVNILQSWRAWLQDYLACKHVSFWQEAMSEVQLSSNSIAPLTDWTQIVKRKYHWKRFLLQWGKKWWETSIPQCFWGQLKYAKIWSVWNLSSATLIATRIPSGWQITAGSSKLHFLSDAYHWSLEQDGLMSISTCFSFFPQILLLFLLCYFWWFCPWTWSNLPSAWVVQAAALHLPCCHWGCRRSFNAWHVRRWPIRSTNIWSLGFCVCWWVNRNPLFFNHPNVANVWGVRKLLPW